MKQVERHAKQYEAELEQLETTKHDLQQKSAELDRRFQEVQAMKKEAKQCQKKIERELQNISVTKSVWTFAVQSLGIGMCYIQKKTLEERQLEGMTQLVVTIEF